LVHYHDSNTTAGNKNSLLELHAFCRNPAKLREHRSSSGIRSILMGDERQPRYLQQALTVTQAHVVILCDPSVEAVRALESVLVGGPGHPRNASSCTSRQRGTRSPFDHVRVLVVSKDATLVPDTVTCGSSTSFDYYYSSGKTSTTASTSQHLHKSDTTTPSSSWMGMLWSGTDHHMSSTNNGTMSKPHHSTMKEIEQILQSLGPRSCILHGVSVEEIVANAVKWITTHVECAVDQQDKNETLSLPSPRRTSMATRSSQVR